MTRALVLAAVLAVCGPSAWAQDATQCSYGFTEAINGGCISLDVLENYGPTKPSDKSSTLPVCENNGWAKPCYDPEGRVTLYPAEQSSNRSITVNGVTIVYPAGDTATIGADGSVTIGGK